jgi:Txe/YoeB family toxin of Txe-Axe toxin-antitoxin module
MGMSGWDAREVSELDHWLRQERQAEQQIGRLVRSLRRDGCPWSVIGTALGITKQAAQQRFGQDAAGVSAPRRKASR